MCDCSGVCGCDEVAVPVGAAGDDGWSPVFAVIVDGARRVLQVVSWTGGGGTAPAYPVYLGGSGFVTDITLAVDVRGAAGAGGTAGQDAYTTVTPSSFVQPAVGAQVNVTVGNSDWMTVGAAYYVTTGGTYTVFSITDATNIVLTNLYTTNAAPGTVIASGNAVVATGLKGEDGDPGADGDNAWTTTTGNFTVPVSPFTAVIGTSSNTNFIAIGEPLFMQGAGQFIVTAKTSSSVTLGNLGYTTNAAPLTVISAGALLVPSGFSGTNGTPGAAGASAYEIAVANGFVGTEAEWLASLVGAAGGTIYQTIFAATDPNTLTYTPTPVDGSLQPTSSGGTFTVWQYSTISGLWVAVATFSGSGGVTSYLFRAENTVAQYLPTNTTAESVISFDDDTNAPNFDPSDSWIDHIYTFQTNQLQKSFRLMNFTLRRPSFAASAKVWTVTIHTSNGSDPLGSFVLSFSGSDLFKTQAVYNTAPVDFTIGDTVWVTASCSTSSSDQFRVSADPNETATFMIL